MANPTQNGALIPDDNGTKLGCSAVNITTNTTTTVKSTSGFIRGIAINTKGATGNTCKVYDGTASDTLLATIDTTANVGTVWFFDTYCSSKITVVTGTGTAGDLTVFYV